MSQKRKTFTPVEKAKIALEAIRSEVTLAQISSKYSVHATQINKWRKQALEQLPATFTNQAKQLQVDHEGELKLLYEQIGRLKIENEFLKKNVTCLPKNRKILLEPDHPNLSIRQQCKLLEINRSSIYYEPQPQHFTHEQLTLLRIVDEVYTQYPFFGTRQMAQYLTREGFEDIKRHHTRWAYERLGLQSTAPGPHTSKPNPEHKIYPYLLKNLNITAVNQVWSTDLTYIRLTHGFVYLMAIIDWFSRFVLDWSLSINMEADFCVETLKCVLANGCCDIFNTDQGAQFTCHDFTNLLNEHHIKISMDGKGRALDNVFVERLWRSVKYECVYLCNWETVAEARKGLHDYFEFYNYKRPHQSLYGKTPAEIYHGF